MNHIQALNEAINDHFPTATTPLQREDRDGPTPDPEAESPRRREWLNRQRDGACSCLRCLALRDLKRQLEKSESPISRLTVKDGRLTCH